MSVCVRVCAEEEMREKEEVGELVYLYSDLPPMVARLEKTLRSVMFSGHDWILR